MIQKLPPQSKPKASIIIKGTRKLLPDHQQMASSSIYMYNVSEPQNSALAHTLAQNNVQY